MTLTKADFALSISRRCGYPKNRSADLVEALLELIKATLASGESLTVSGFGKICVRKRGRRGVRAPLSRDAGALAADTTVTFRCSAVLKNRINGSRPRPIQAVLPEAPKGLFRGSGFPLPADRGTAREDPLTVGPG